MSQTQSPEHELAEPLVGLKKALIVSAQAAEGEPLCAPEHICALALSALNGGAKGLRLEGVENIRYLRARTAVPLVGLTKGVVPDAERYGSVYITATFAEAQELANAGADIIALDATNRPRPDGVSLKELIGRIATELKRPVWADVSTLEEGALAAEYGASVVSTTLYGYTAETKLPPDAPPDFDLVRRLCNELSVPVVLEGRVWQPAEVARAFELGVFAVVVGSAITRPQLITQRFVQAIPAASAKSP
ncbi:MAG: N-acetylmannosamine-6-phosphate 2-epimerase [Candidatus Obscuribacterales bacterium]|nr:N-acetylmannosamine-6-phosphate 2-epimerase [Candidatus Obscuribacterales bacterium]